MWLPVTIVVLMTQLQCTRGQDEVEGSGQDYLLPVHPVPVSPTHDHQLAGARHHVLQQVKGHKCTESNQAQTGALNVSTNMEVLDVLENLASNKLTITFWITDTWHDPKLMFPPDLGNSVALDPADLLPAISSPKTTVKNAMLLKEWPHSQVLHVSSAGQLSHTRKLSADVRCRKLYGGYRGQMDYLQQKLMVYKYNCSLVWGSYLRTADLINLQWDPVAPFNNFFNWICQPGASALGTQPCTVTYAETHLPLITNFMGHSYQDIVVDLQVETRRDFYLLNRWH